MLEHEDLGTLKLYAKLTFEDLKKAHRKCQPQERGEER